MTRYVPRSRGLTVCTCAAGSRGQGFTATGPKARGIPAHWFVHAACGLPTGPYRAAMEEEDRS